MLIVFEGIVGSGKTTQSKKLYEYLKQKFPKKTVIWTREPGGSEIADAIRKVVQATKFETEEMEPICESYLYAASRAQTLRTIVLPVLKKGGVVVMDRSYLTSLSYQAYGRGLGAKIVSEINKIAIKDFKPDVIFFIKRDLKTSLNQTFDKHGDKFESMDLSFFERAAKGYIAASKSEAFKKVWKNIDGNGSIEKVFENIVKALPKDLL